MTQKLYTHGIDGAGCEVSTTTYAADGLKPTTERPSEEQFIMALKRLQGASVEGEVVIPDAVAVELRKNHATWDAVRAAMRKLRKACCKCRWCVLERDGKHKSKRHTHWYCKFMHMDFGYQSRTLGLKCTHFKRKSKSKEAK